MTPAGATYPYGLDPNDSNIRIAPSFPALEELLKATELFALCVKLSSISKILRDREIAEKDMKNGRKSPVKETAKVQEKEEAQNK